MAVHENTSIPSAKQSRFSQITTRQFLINHPQIAFPTSLATPASGKILDFPRLRESITHRSEGR